MILTHSGHWLYQIVGALSNRYSTHNHFEDLNPNFCNKSSYSLRGKVSLLILELLMSFSTEQINCSTLLAAVRDLQNLLFMTGSSVYALGCFVFKYSHSTGNVMIYPFRSAFQQS